MPPISAVIITLNEESCIERCIRSVLTVADEVVVVDSLSTDRTPEICRKLGEKFIEQKFLGYIEQKNFALEQAAFDHVLSLDADEALSEELSRSILKVKDNWKHDAYQFNRLNKFCGHWIHHTNYYPDRKLRLFDRRKGQWGGVNPHDKVIMDPGTTTGRLKGDLLHWLCETYEEHIDTINKFSTIAAREAFKKGEKCPAWKVFYKPVWRFIQYYFVKRGFMDGYMGLVVSRNSAFLNFQKYAKLRNLIQLEKNNEKFLQADEQVNIAQAEIRESDKSPKE